MALPKLGRGSVIGLKDESTWGTGVTPDRFFKAVEFSGGEEHRYAARPDLYQENGWVVGGHYLEGIDTSFRVRLEALAEGMGELFEAIMWATVSSTGVGDPYTHAYALTATLPAGFTLEGQRGTGTAETLAGCMVSKTTFSCQPGQPLYVECEGIAKSSTGRGSATSPTFTSNYLPLRHHHAGTLTWNSRTFQIRRFTLTLDRKLERRQLLGSNYTDQPTPSAFADVMIELELEYIDDNLYTDIRAGTQADAAVTFTNTTNRSLAFTVHDARLTGNVNPDVNKAGVLTNTVRLVGVDDGTNRGLRLVVVNSQSSGVAA